ncbi:ORF6N domain-containing protein, partial [Absiella sp. AM27-20]|uniref:ORF6N domain-containing protein n=1 Tax=Absiella sp. AM27-20 TaxID=2292277 RepID=UPI0029438F36
MLFDRTIITLHNNTPFLILNFTNLDKRGQTQQKGENMNELQIIEYSNQRVLTTQQLAEVYETSETNIKTNFNRNKERFVAGKHYYVLKGDD